jgi:restriction system protein
LILVNNLILFIGDILRFILDIWHIWFIIALGLALSLAYCIWKDRRLSRSGIEDVDSKDIDSFKEKVETVIGRLGYRVEWSNYSSDHGFNIVASKDGVKVLIQAIQSQGRVGVKTVQDAIKEKGFSGCNEVILVTNNYFSERATGLASRNGVVLWNRDDLIESMLDTGEEGPPEEKPVPYENVTKHFKSIEEFMEEQCKLCTMPANDEELRTCQDNLQESEGIINCKEYKATDS